jgi:hypothetical protein
MPSNNSTAGINRQIINWYQVMLKTPFSPIYSTLAAFLHRLIG